MKNDFLRRTTMGRLLSPFGSLSHSLVTRLLPLLVMLFSIGIGNVWGDEVIFSADVTATSKTSIVAGTTSASSYATITGGSLDIVNGQSSAKDMIASSCSSYGFCLTNNNTVLKVTLSKAIETGDVISAKVVSTTSDNKSDPQGRGLVFTTSTSTPSSYTAYFNIAKANSAAWTSGSYTVQSTDEIVGKTVFYICRQTGNSTYVDEISITRSSGCTTPTIDWTTEPADGTVGGSMTAAVSTNQSGVSVAWASTDESVAKVVDGVITYLAAGEATISASYTGSGDYCSKLAKVEKKITVTASEPAATYKMIENGALNTTNFRLPNTNLKSGNHVIDGVKYTNYLLFGTTNSALIGVYDPTKYIAFDTKSNATSVELVVYNSNSSSKDLTVLVVPEGAAVADCTPQTLSFDGTSGDVRTIPMTGRSTLYLSVGNTNLLICQIRVHENGTTLPKAGENGYVLNLNKGRLAAKSGAVSTIDDIEFHAPTSNYGVLSATSVPFKTLGSNYVKFTLPSAATLKVTTSGTAKYYVANAADGTTNETTPTANAATSFALEAGTWYINPAGSNVSITKIEFAAAPQSYNVKFAAGGGSGTMDDVSVMEGASYSLPACTFTAPDGQEFDKWTLSVASGDAPEVTEGKFVMPAQDVTLTATWKAATVYSAITYAETKSADMSAYPTKYAEGTGIASFDPLDDVSGFHFLGWSPASIEAAATGAQTITAQWEAVNWLVRAKLTSKQAADMSGTVGGTFSYNSLGDIDAKGGCKLGSTGSYMGVTLTSGNFQAGDKVVAYCTNLNGYSSSMHVYSSASDLIGDNGTNWAVDAENSYVLPEDLASGINSIYLSRPAKADQNVSVSWFKVLRASSAALNGVKKEGSALTEGTDYTINNDVITLTASCQTMPTITLGKKYTYPDETDATVDVTVTLNLSGSNYTGTATIGSTTYTVNVPYEAPAVKPAFTTDLNPSYEIAKNASQVLTIAATGAQSYQWWKKATAAAMDSTALESTTETYTYTGTAKGTEYVYCTATNTVGSTNSTVAAITTLGSSACELDSILFSNGIYGAIGMNGSSDTTYYVAGDVLPTGMSVGDIKSIKITVPYLAGTDAPTVQTTWQSAGATYDKATNVLTAEDGVKFITYTIETKAITPLDVTADVATTNFDAVPSWVFNPYGYDDSKGLKFAKADNKSGANKRISKGTTRQYYFISAAKTLTLTSGATSRKINVYLNGQKLSTPTASGASGSTIDIALDATKTNLVCIESAQTGGDGGFTKYAITYNTYVAEVNGVKKTSLAKAFADAQDGETVKLLDNINGAEEYKNAANITLDLNNYTWNSSDATATLKNNGGTITITDNSTAKGGKITSTNEAVDAGIAVWARTGSITIEGGTFETNNHYEATAYVGTSAQTSAVLTINGGTFKNNSTEPYEYKKSMSALTVNMYNSLTYAALIINGGTFYGNDPWHDDNITSEWGIFTPAGKTTSQNAGGAYGVIDASEDASLKSLTVDGVDIPGFAAATLSYEYEYPYASVAIPQVAGVANEAHATVAPTQAATLSEKAKIVVLAQDRRATKTYEVSFKEGEQPKYTTLFDYTWTASSASFSSNTDYNLNDAKYGTLTTGKSISAHSGSSALSVSSSMLKLGQNYNYIEIELDGVNLAVGDRIIVSGTNGGDGTRYFVVEPESVSAEDGAATGLATDTYGAKDAHDFTAVVTSDWLTNNNVTTKVRIFRQKGNSMNLKAIKVLRPIIASEADELASVSVNGTDIDISNLQPGVELALSDVYNKNNAPIVKYIGQRRVKYLDTSLADLVTPYAEADANVAASSDGKKFEATFTFDGKSYLITTGRTELDPVAKIEGKGQYFTLADAFAAVEADETIVVLSDVTLSARVDAAVAAAYTVDLGGKTITPTRSCGNGSAFNIQYGTVTFKNGTIDGTALTQTAADGYNNECDAITVRSGAKAILVDGLTIKVNSITGSCAYAFDGSKIEVTGGSYSNASTTVGPDHENAMCLNQANVPTQLIEINGGTYEGADPKLGDNSAAGCKNFCAVGYTTVMNAAGKFEAELKTDVEPISTHTVWDFAKVADAQIQLTQSTTPAKGEFVIVNRIPGVINSADFKTASMKFAGEYLHRSDDGTNYPSCAKEILFNTTVDGFVTVKFADNGSNNRQLDINGTKSQISSGKTNYQTFMIFVKAGDVDITGYQSGESGSQYMRFFKVEFTPTTDATALNLNEGPDGKYYATFSNNDKAVAFADEVAYTATTSDRTVSFEKIAGGRVPAATGTLIQSTSDKAYYIVLDENLDALTQDNQMKPALSTNKTEATQAGHIYYKLAYAAGTTDPATMGFYYGTLYTGGEFTINAGKAYLDVDTNGNGGAAPTRFLFGGSQIPDAATGLDAINANTKDQKMLLNGQILIIRNGRVYDAAGRLMK